MQAFTSHGGQAVAIDQANIDTDQIIPKQFLKTITREGLGIYLFDAWRYSDEGYPGKKANSGRLSQNFLSTSIHKRVYYSQEIISAADQAENMPFGHSLIMESESLLLLVSPISFFKTASKMDFFQLFSVNPISTSYLLPGSNSHNSHGKFL